MSVGAERKGEEEGGHGGIPRAVFVVNSWSSILPCHRQMLVRMRDKVQLFFCSQEDVDEFMKKSENTSAEVVLKRFDELYNKYKFMEANLVQKKKR